MTPGSNPPVDSDEPLSPELERHLADPAQKTEEVSGEQERARTSDQTPTEPGATTENQPT